LNKGNSRLGFDTTLLTTAMGILPHRDPDKALELAFSLDIPFWPQLPNLSFSEDTYVQTVKGMPGAEVDYEGLRILFDENAFYEGLEQYLSLDALDDIFAVTPGDSATYAGFLERASSAYPSLRGQFMGPISLCLMVKDADNKPIIYRDDAREVAIRHVANRVNRHLADLRAINPRSFVWVDEPGLEFLFTGITGYTSERIWSCSCRCWRGRAAFTCAAIPIGTSCCSPKWILSHWTPTTTGISSRVTTVAWPTSWGTAGSSPGARFPPTPRCSRRRAPETWLIAWNIYGKVSRMIR
jgi:hypothetical protein